MSGRRILAIWLVLAAGLLFANHFAIVEWGRWVAGCIMLAVAILAVVTARLTRRR